MSLSARKWIDNVEVLPNARIPVGPPREPNLRFSVTTVCDAVSPERWHGEVLYGRHMVIKTAPADSHAAAARAVVAAFEAKVERAVLALFSDG